MQYHIQTTLNNNTKTNPTDNHTITSTIPTIKKEKNVLDKNPKPKKK